MKGAFAKENTKLAVINGGLTPVLERHDELFDFSDVY